MVVGKEEIIEYLRTSWILEKVGGSVEMDKMEEFFDNHLYFFCDKDCGSEVGFYFDYGDCLFLNQRLI